MTIAAESRAHALSPAEPAAVQLEFVRNTRDSAINQRYYRVSSCGRYTVSKCSVAGVDVYDAWRVRGTSEPADHLGTRKSAVAAMNLCQRHSERRR